MRLVQINPVLRVSTSTGRIMQEIGDLAMANGWECYAAYSQGRDGLMPTRMHPLPVGDKLSTAFHGLETRLFDRHGLASRHATKEFISRLKEIKPDIIHIHNIHGYFLNYPLFFRYLSESGVKVVWTVHDCWLYTGHCYYYSFAGCDRWKSGCGNCPQRTNFPKSWIIDRSAGNFKDKQKAFTSLRKENFMIVPVSQWMRDEMAHSFLKDYNFRVIHNGIDTNVFSPQTTLSKFKIQNSKLYLALASIWLREKGLYDIIEMSKLLNPDERIVMVGVDDKTARILPENITAIRRTANVDELARLYSDATAFLNPTWQDNYPTVNLEAISCGTPVVTYRTGGSIEAITPETGRIVDQGDIRGMLEAAREIAGLGEEHFRMPCRNYALANFRKEDRYADYLKLYNEILDL